MDAETVLIILLSVCLIAFLVVAIVFFIHLIRISRRVHSLTEKADTAADNIVSASEAMRKIATPLAVSGVIGRLIERVVHTKSRKGRK